MKPKRPIYVLACLLLLFLSGCTGTAASPEAAALQALMKGGTTGLVIDPDSVQIPQIVDWNGGQKLVLLTFGGTRPDMGRVLCLYYYEVNQQALGWRAGSGGGFCRADTPEQAVDDLEMSGGRAGGQRPLDPGYAQAFGWAHNPGIVKVRVTWDDGSVTGVEVVDGTFMALRSGQFVPEKVEGLDAADQVIYTYLPNWNLE